MACPLAELASFVVQYDADVLFWKTYLRFSLPSYTCYLQNRLLQTRHPLYGSTAILIYMRATRKSLFYLIATLIEGCGVAVDARGLELRIVSVCLRSDQWPHPPPGKWDAFLDPVSYTHLDVYKRQRLKCVHSGKLHISAFFIILKISV